MKPLRLLLVAFVLATGCSEAEGASGASEEYAPPSNEFGERMAECLANHGWEATVHPDGSYELEVPESQADQVKADEEQCLEDTGYDRPSEPIDEERAAEIFDLYVKAAECIEEQGYEVAEHPSRETAVELIVEGNLGLEWDPYEDAFKNPRDGEPDIYELCPHPLDQ